MYICDKCGKVLEDEYWEDMYCEDCGGTLTLPVKCPNCGEYHAPTSNCGFLCEECLKEEMTFENAKAIGQRDSEEIRLNGFITYTFTAEEIEDILLDYIKNHADKDKFIKDYFNFDVDILDSYLMKTKYAKKEKGNNELPF